jgi:hypothetical protein
MDYFMDGGKKGKKMETDTVAVLYAKAKEYKIVGRSKMRKAELIAAIRAKQKEIGQKISKRRS